MKINAHGLVDQHPASDADVPASALSNDGNFFILFLLLLLFFFNLTT